MSMSSVRSECESSVQPGAAPAIRGPAFSRVVVCADSSKFTQRVLAQGMLVARALDIPLMLLRVLEVGTAGESPSDPVAWEIRRRVAHFHLEQLAEQCAEDCDPVAMEVVEGQAVEQISLWAEDHPHDLMVLGSHGECGPGMWGLGITARQVVERATGSLLLVPCAGAGREAVRFRRLLVPLDGSCRAESVLPLAVRLAQGEQAELLLVHIVPVPELTEIGPLEAEDIDLRERLFRRNERVARAYLDRLRTRVAGSGVAARAVVLRGDARASLPRLVADADIVVLSAYGHSGRADVPYGSVTAHLTTHTTAPLLIARRQPVATARREAGAMRLGLRFPSRAVG